jgi:hypothetical protein
LERPRSSLLSGLGDLSRDFSPRGDFSRGDFSGSFSDFDNNSAVDKKVADALL